MRIFDERFVGTTMMILAAALFSTMAVFVRLASSSVPTGEIVFIRYGLSTLLFYGLYRFARLPIRPVNTRLLIMRSVAAAFGGVFYFFAVSRITMGEAVILKYLYPFFAVGTAALLYGEKTDRTVVVLIVMSVAGVVVMVNPAHFDPQPGYIWGILTGLSAGAAVAFVRKLRDTDDSSTIMFFTSATGVVVSAPLALKGFAVPVGVPLLLVLGASFCGIGAQFVLVYGMRYIKTGAACVVMAFEVVLSAFLGWLVLDQTVDPHHVAGGLLILSGGFIIILRQGSTHKQADAGR